MIPRLTTRRLMLAIAALAVALGTWRWLDRRASWRREQAAAHTVEWMVYARVGTEDGRRLALSHFLEASTWRRAAERLWLPVGNRLGD